MRCLVTGGAGFIGSHVVDYLVNEGHNVVVIDDLSGGYIENINTKANFVKKDLVELDQNDPLLRDVDIVYHLAAFPAEGLSLFMPYYIAQKNYIAFLRLLTSCINTNVKTIVFTSSMSVYGDNPQIPFDERQPRNPVDPYGICKAMCERLLEIYSEEYGFNYVIIRPHNVYGIRQNLQDPYRNVIGIWINRILNGMPPIIYGNGEQTRAFSYIGSVAPCIAKSAFIGKCYENIINLGGARSYAIADVCKMVIEAFGEDCDPLFYPPRPREVKHAYCTIEKSIKLLGFRESKSLGEGIKEMVDWAKSLPKPKFRYMDKRMYEITKKMPKTWLWREM